MKMLRLALLTTTALTVAHFASPPARAETNGAPVVVATALGVLLDLPVSSARPIDATWVDATTVAALGSDSGADTVISYVIGGSAGDPSRTDDAIRLVGGGDSDSLRLLTRSGEVQQLRASGWQNIVVGASLLATQQ